MLYENCSYNGGHLALSQVVVGNEDTTTAAPNNMQSDGGSGGGVVYFIQLSLINGSNKELILLYGSEQRHKLTELLQ